MTDTTNNDQSTTPTREQIAHAISQAVGGWNQNTQTIQRAADAVVALFSQPSPSTPSIEPRRITYVEANEHQTFCAKRLARHPDEEACTCEPVSIEDMAAGTTFTARDEDGDQGIFMRVHGPGWVVSSSRSRLVGEELDPSTVRAVTPPPALPEDGR